VRSRSCNPGFESADSALAFLVLSRKHDLRVLSSG
jgi:hypothetical protein